MVFNSDKFQGIIFESKKLSTREPIDIYDNEGKVFQTLDTVRNLGILVDKDLTFSQELDETIRKGNKRLHWIMRYFIIRDPKILLPIFKATVLSGLDFPNLLTASPSEAKLARL